MSSLSSLSNNAKTRSTLHDILNDYTSKAKESEATVPVEQRTKIMRIPMLLNRRAVKKRRLLLKSNNNNEDAEGGSIEVAITDADPSKVVDNKTKNDTESVEEQMGKTRQPPKRDEKSKPNETTTIVNASTTSITKNYTKSLEYYKEMIDACKKQMEEQQKRYEKHTNRKIVELRNVYLYGLQQVSSLQDLREAPDAILPGNFTTSE